MILLRNEPHILVPVLKHVWSPSLSLKKDQMGNDIERNQWRLRARSNDGVVVWTGYFYDRDEADAFLFAIANGTLKQERALWDLPTPNWQPYLGELISYEFVKQTFLTGTGSSSWSDPLDFPQGANNRIDCIGAGGSGGAVYSVAGHAAGGGGGAWSSSTDLTITFPLAYSCGTGGGAITSSLSGQFQSGADGGDTTINTTTIVAKGGKGGTGQKTSGTSASGGAGGAASSGTGATKVNGGRGGNTSTTDKSSSGGGGAGGPGSGNSGTGSAGNQGTDSSTTGGSGGGGSGGSGGGSGVSGGNGTEYDSTHGSGGGGGGSTSTAGSGGNYGGGGGGACTGNSTVTSGAGKQGLVYVEYTPKTGVSFNMPMLGM